MATPTGTGDVLCITCRSPLPPGTHRRLLKPPSPSTVSASRFLSAYVSPSLLLSEEERAFACKSCFAKLEKGCKTIHAVQQIVSDLRGTLSLPPVAVSVTTEFPDAEKPVSQVQKSGPQRPQAPQVAGPPAKRARRSLSFSPVSEGRGTRTVSVQTPEVKVTILRPGQAARKFNVPRKYKKMVQSIRYRHSPYTVRTMLKASPLKRTVISQLSTTIRRECAAMCSRNHGDSVLRLLSVLELKDFSWNTLLQELKKEAPTLLQLLTAASSRHACTNPGIVGMAASLLLYGRNPQLCVPQALNSVLLYAGHTAKVVYTRLRKLGVCVSHKRTTTLIKQLGDSHDVTVRKWRQLLECPEEVEELDNISEDEDMETDMASPSSVVVSAESPTDSSSGGQDILSSESDSVVASSVSENSCSLSTSDPCTYTLVGDNLDKTISPRYMRSDNQRQSIHYFHMYAALDRVNAVDLPADHPVGDISTTPLSAFLPSPADCKVLRENYAVLLGRSVVKKLAFFRVFEDCVDRHITHKHSDVMKQKSVIVPLGILPNNENLTDEMVDILKDMQQKYVPVDHQDGTVVLQQTAFAGDQLTAARARKSQTIRVNSKSPTDAIRGLAPFAADWHAKVNFMEIIWTRLYSTESSRDGGTLHQLRNLINRVNVGRKELKHQVNQVEDFLEIVIECHLIAAAMHFFGMKSVDDSPSRSGFSDELKQLPLYQRKKVFFDRMTAIVDEYVVPQQFSLPREHTASASDTSSLTNPHVPRIQQEHAYGLSTAKEVHRRHLPPSILSVARRPTVSQPVRRTAPDGVLNYASAVLNDGLLLLEFKDAIREGDGIRILRCWKVLLMYYRMANHTNYASEAFHFIAQVTATASPRVASQLLWSRVVNTKGKKGHNVPADMHMEHLNRTVKEYIAGVGANVSQSTIIQCGQSLGGMMTVMKNYDRVNNVRPSSGKHTKKSDIKDEELILKELNERSRVFDYIPGRKHSCKKFDRLEPNVAIQMDKTKLFQWLSDKKKAAAKSMKFSKLFRHSV